MEIFAPLRDVNDSQFTLTRWYAEDTSLVKKNQLLAEVETSKAVYDVESPADGYLIRNAEEGGLIAFEQAIGRLFSDLDDAMSFKESLAKTVASDNGSMINATKKAVLLAKELGVDLDEVSTGRLITAKDIRTFVEQQEDDVELALPCLSAESEKNRVLLIGGGLGATQVIDILSHDLTSEVVGIVDDTRDKWGSHIAGVPIVGSTRLIQQLYAEKAFDSAIIAISTSVPARNRYRLICEETGIKLANAIDPSCTIGGDVNMGAGNVLCAFVHLGTGATLGDNNFISAYNSFDHHCVIGSDCSTGPGCMCSGSVELGDQVRMGTGIFIQHKVRLGEGVLVSSGSVITTSIPDNHTVKSSVETTVVVPNRSKV